jgi:uncharacterized protein (TIGR03000 family)
MYTHGIGRRWLAALAAGLVTAGVSSAQVGNAGSAATANTPTAGLPPYSYGPGYYGYASDYGNGIWRGPRFTSLQYPGIYGAYFLGPGGTFYEPRMPTFSPYAPPPTSPNRPVTDPPRQGAQLVTGLPRARTQADLRTAQELPSNPVDDAAHIRVLVPEQARLWFNGVRMRKQGSVRTFVSPGLYAGHGYTYEITARWDENGKPVTRTKNIHIGAGDRVDVDLNDEEAGPAPEVAPKPSRSLKTYRPNTPPTPPPASTGR